MFGMHYMTPAQQVQAMVFPEGVELHKVLPGGGSYARDSLRAYRLLEASDADFAPVQAMLFQGAPMEWSCDSALGMVLGNVVGDAIGAPLEFHPVQYGVREVVDMGGEPWNHMRFHLKPGQWTDDASMALCIADSLLVSGREAGIDGRDLRLRFLNWWDYGYNNAFANDAERRGGSSVGLGGNISMSFGDFQRNRGERTLAGDRFTSGNGSVMRNGPVACCYWNDTQRAMAESERQSYTTHQGVEAAECARLLSFVCTSAAQTRGTAQEVLALLEKFESSEYSVQCLAASRNEERCEANAKFDLADRAWNWKDPNHRYSPQRSKEMPGYVGSYAMDAVAMALHCVWTTNSFPDAVLKCVNMRGDSDSVGAVCAQMAGAIYGVSSIPRNWIEAVQRWDDGLSALKAYKLWKGVRVVPPSVDAIARLWELDRQELQFIQSQVKLQAQLKLQNHKKPL